MITAKIYRNHKRVEKAIPWIAIFAVAYGLCAWITFYLITGADPIGSTGTKWIVIAPLLAPFVIGVADGIAMTVRGEILRKHRKARAAANSE